MTRTLDSPRPPGIYIRNGCTDVVADISMPRANTPEDLLPLTPAVFHILVALSEGERHGYAIMRQVSADTGGSLQLGPGTLYGCLKRMLTATDRGIGRAAGPRTGRRTPTVLPHHRFRRADRQSGGAAAGDVGDGGARRRRLLAEMREEVECQREADIRIWWPGPVASTASSSDIPGPLCAASTGARCSSRSGTRPKTP